MKNGTSAQVAPQMPAGSHPGDSWRGCTTAVGVVGLWAVCLVTLLSRPLDGMPLPLVVLAVPIMTFLYTGLFITAHDAMHGTIAPGRPRVNAFFGWLCTVVYALFSFNALKREHGRHHTHPGTEEDPDYHGGRDRFVWWYLRFMWHYMSWPQLIGMALVYNLLLHVVGVPQANLLLFWVAPSLLSTLQLFYFGTYLVHKAPEGGHRNVHKAVTSRFPTWLSFLTCYHFGRHQEHHAHPAVPWWRLHRVPYLPDQDPS